MQAVILAAGRGTRMASLTEEVPKPMLTVHGKTLLEHKFEELPDEVTEIILIIGYKGDVIRKQLGDTWHGKKLMYVEQETLDGTAGALWRARAFLTDRFIIMMGDDLYGRDDVARLAATPDWSLAVFETPSMASGGKMIVDGQGAITAIEEGDHRGTPGKMCTNLFCLDTRIFDFPLVPKSAGSDEYGLPQTVLAAAKAGGIPFSAVNATTWFQVTAPEDLPRAEAWLSGTR